MENTCQDVRENKSNVQDEFTEKGDSTGDVEEYDANDQDILWRRLS
jgi:hypothetical protein